MWAEFSKMAAQVMHTSVTHTHKLVKLQVLGHNIYVFNIQRTPLKKT